MISYSTNWMGPISNKWYEDRNIPFVMKKSKGIEPFPVREYREYLESYSGGRIDIRGVPDDIYGREYGLPIMLTEDWYALSDWLNDFESEELVPYNELISMFEKNYGQSIFWATI